MKNKIIKALLFLVSAVSLAVTAILVIYFIEEGLEGKFGKSYEIYAKILLISFSSVIISFAFITNLKWKKTTDTLKAETKESESTNLEFQFVDCPGRSKIYLNVIYLKEEGEAVTLEFTQMLQSRLYKKIPFSYEQSGYTYITFPYDSRKKGNVLRISVAITYQVSDEQALSLLKERGFVRCFE